MDDRRIHNAFDQLPVRVIERPTRHAECRFHLIGVTAAPERNADTPVEHPPHRQMDYTPVKTALCQLIELPDGIQILGKSGRLEFRVDTPQIVTVELGVGSHAPAQQSSAERTIAERRDLIGTTVSHALRLDDAVAYSVRTTQL